MLSNFAFDYAIRKAQENKKGLKFNGTLQLVVYADDVILSAETINTVKRDTGKLFVTNREVCLEVLREPQHKVRS